MDTKNPPSRAGHGGYLTGLRFFQKRTSALVIAEGHGWFLRRYDQGRAIQFLNFVEELSVLSIRAFDGRQVKKASRLVRKFGDQPLTHADAHGLGIIRGQRISVCWSTDRHLGLTGAKRVTQGM